MTTPTAPPEQPPPAPQPFYIKATSPPEEGGTRVLKQGETFAVFDRHGDIRPGPGGKEGLYHEGTRYLSGLLLSLGDERPLLLSSTVRQDNELLAVDLTNLDVTWGGQVVIPRGSLHVSRTKFLWQGACYEHIRFRNYGPVSTHARFFLHFEADFADIFEVRGTHRPRRGRMLEPAPDGNLVVLSYEGLDGVVRRTRLDFSPGTALLSPSLARFEADLDPGEEACWSVTVSCHHDGEAAAPPPYEAAFRASAAAQEEVQSRLSRVHTTSHRFDGWLERAAADLYMMTTRTPLGPYPYAGVPWFSTPFGRDGIITALECLWLDPTLARGVLAFLAATQATEVSPEQDAEPGKILHEARGGEMAALKEIPFGRYYGSIDATPLFVWLAAEYHERTDDLEFIRSIWPNLERALDWIDVYGDRDRDGFVEYERMTPQGLAQQGWKDSHDSVFHADGTPAEPPIALCEVQGYVYAAKRGAARLASLLGHGGYGQQLLRQAVELRKEFEGAFWCEDVGTYALALDGRKRPCRVRTSNAGHCLLTGIASPERAERVAETLLDPNGYSGWGVRTLAAGEANYNPMSYHNGSVWPHDNALIAAGLAHYGLTEGALKITRGLFDASQTFDLERLPELFCGFPRRPGEGPVQYPVACAPQAWAAGAVYLLLQSCLGLNISAAEGRVSFTRPLLPRLLREVRIENLRVGDAAVDLLLQRHKGDVGIHVLRRDGDVEVVTIK